MKNNGGKTMKEVTAAIIIKSGKILICQRSKTDNLSGKWEFPGGKIEPGETPEECLKREIKEELSIEVEVCGKFGESIYEYPAGEIKLMAFYADWKSGDIELNVHDSFEWVSKESIGEFNFAPADIPFVNKIAES
jgi:8-oxo-dGTP diphosphatase